MVLMQTIIIITTCTNEQKVVFLYLVDMHNFLIVLKDFAERLGLLPFLFYCKSSKQTVFVSFYLDMVCSVLYTQFYICAILNKLLFLSHLDCFCFRVPRIIFFFGFCYNLSVYIFVYFLHVSV